MRGTSWPVAEMDTVRRMRVLAGALGAAYDDAYLDVPFDEVWTAFCADADTGVPVPVADLRAFRAAGCTGAGTRAVDGAGPRGGAGERFHACRRRPPGAVGADPAGDRPSHRVEIDLRPGWCLVSGRFLVRGFAAAREGGGTRFAACSGLRLPGARLALRLMGRHASRRFARRLMRRAIRRLSRR